MQTKLVRRGSCIVWVHRKVGGMIILLEQYSLQSAPNRLVIVSIEEQDNHAP